MYSVFVFAVNLPVITTSCAGIVNSFSAISTLSLSQPLNVYPGAVAFPATSTLAPYLYVASSGNSLAPSGAVPSYA